MGEPSPLRNPLGTRGSACVEVMTTLHGSTSSPWRRVEGCVPPEGFHSYTWVHLWTFRAALVIVGFGYPLHSLILEAIAGLGQKIDGQQAPQVLP
ncbi:hypothetical protein CK203_113385 [Vitis vinifera]|uniref:Uncharacterized protein n=1 Tax=Vitis vinifera TaxID=29760 RepID=A0A438FCU0_VITVI|nr:hypothetical protein CK203_113385 [Vitis vinifera]